MLRFSTRVQVGSVAALMRPEPPGNVATATVVRALRQAGADIPYDLDAVDSAHIEIRDYLGVNPASSVMQLDENDRA